MKRSILCLLLVLLLISALAPAVVADEDTPRVIDAEVFGSVEFEPSNSPRGLLVQATAWMSGDDYYYLVSVLNMTPWAIRSPYILDRYFPEDPEQEEIATEWQDEVLEPGQSASLSMTVYGGPLPGGCHQIELSFAGAFSAVLMDCAVPNATAIWNVPIRDDIAAMMEEEEEPPAIPLEPLAVSDGRSLIGLHVTRNSAPEIMDFVHNAQPAIVAGVGDLGWLADVKEASPGTITVGRFLEGDQSFDGDPAQRARDFVNENAGNYAANPGVDYWLGWNEPVIDEVWQASWYAVFEAERTIAMAELGLKVAVGNFPAGNPEAAEFEAFIPAIEVAREYGGLLALHEYSAPNIDTGVGDGIPGLEARDDSGSLTLRYRYWYENYLLPNGLSIPLIITEAGVDGGVLKRDDVSLFGWREFQDDAPEELRTQSEDIYLDQLSWYDDQLRADPYVLGFAIFNAGDPDGDWASFDVTPLLPALADTINSKD